MVSNLQDSGMMLVENFSENPIPNNRLQLEVLSSYGKGSKRLDNWGVSAVLEGESSPLLSWLF